MRGPPTGPALTDDSLTTQQGVTVEVKIGVQHAARELVLESAQTAADIEKTVADALAAERGLLSLADERGRRVIVPVDRLAYVEIGETAERRVGFGTM
ncbi:MAG TPA: DUF3107 domain-containing protein [Jiangellales bacterium]|nr:DUF3107 domain-containing protein [Jiangellales bacterium]